MTRKEIPYEEFKELIIQGKTVKELEIIYNCSRSHIAETKKKYNLVGLTPNSKRIDRGSGIKVCSQCGLEKSLDEYYSNGYSPTGKQKYKSKCNKCENECRDSSFKSKVQDYLDIKNIQYKCTDCGYDEVPEVLEFHHLNPSIKEFDIGRVSKTLSIDMFMEQIAPELDKCVLVCPTCHRVRHYIMGQT